MLSYSPLSGSLWRVLVAHGTDEADFLPPTPSDLAMDGAEGLGWHGGVWMVWIGLDYAKQAFLWFYTR